MYMYILSYALKILSMTSPVQVFKCHLRNNECYASNNEYTSTFLLQNLHFRPAFVFCFLTVAEFFFLVIDNILIAYVKDA